MVHMVRSFFYIILFVVLSQEMLETKPYFSLCTLLMVFTIKLVEKRIRYSDKGSIDETNSHEQI